MDDLLVMNTIPDNDKREKEIKELFEKIVYTPSNINYDDDYELLCEIDKAIKNQNLNKNLVIRQYREFSKVSSYFASKNVLERVFQEQRYDLLEYFFKKSSLFDDEIIDKYGDIILEKILDKTITLTYRTYDSNDKLFKKCFYKLRENPNYIELLINNFNYLSNCNENIRLSGTDWIKNQAFDENLSVEEMSNIITNDYGMIILEKILQDKIKLSSVRYITILNLFNDKNLYEECLSKLQDNEDYIKLVIEFPFFRQDLDKIGNILIRKILDKTISLPSSLHLNKEFFKICLNSENGIQIISKFDKIMIFDEIIKKTFTKDDIKTICSQIGIDVDPDMLEYKLTYFNSINEDFLGTIDYRLLDKKFDKIKIQDMEKIILYDDLQDIVLSLDEKGINILSKILSFLNTDKYDFSGVIYNIIMNIQNDDIDNLNYLNLINNIDVDSLSEEQIKNLINVLKREENIFKVENANDLTNNGIEQARKRFFKNIEDKINNNSISLGEIRNAIFMKKYGIDYDEADFIYKRYCFDFENTCNDTKLSEEVRKILLGIHYIYCEKSIDDLILLFKESNLAITDTYSFISLESSLRREYAKMYSDSLYKLDGKEKSKNPLFQNVEYNGKVIDFYEPVGDFNMQIHALGAYTRGEWERPDNFKEDWNRPQITSHGLCTSYIGNNQIATARPNGPILGFSEYEESALLLAGNYDLVSRGANLKYAVSSHKPYNFLTPKMMIDSTRHNHNELVLERRKNSNGHNSSFKRTPDYIVYVVDSIEDKVAFSKDNDYYNQTLQAAADFGVPVVVIDRLKYAKREKIKCDELEKIFDNSGSVEVLEELFLTYMNNNVGCRIFRQVDSMGHVIQKEPSEYQKIFTDEVVKNFFERTITKLNSNVFTEEQKKQICDKLIDMLKRENANYNGSNGTKKCNPPFSIAEALNTINSIDNLISLREAKKIIEEGRKESYGK